MLYFDSACLLKLYIAEPGFEAVRSAAHASAAPVASAILARVEVTAALHRKLRERAITKGEFQLLLGQFGDDQQEGRYRWLAQTEAVLLRAEQVIRGLPDTVWLRAADAIHLATAAEAGFREIHSNDARMLKAAAKFKLKGVDPTR